MPGIGLATGDAAADKKDPIPPSWHLPAHLEGIHSFFKYQPQMFLACSVNLSWSYALMGRHHPAEEFLVLNYTKVHPEGRAGLPWWRSG